MQPLVSVVIPTLPERKHLLQRAVASVHAQTYSNIEIIPVSDGSNACEARNIGITKAQGDFIAFLDDDDTWYPMKIEKQVKHMLEHPSICLVICYSDDQRRYPHRISHPPDIVKHSDLVKGFNLSSTSSYLVRRYALEMVYNETGCFFDESLPSGHEYDLALRMTLRSLSRYHEIHCIPEVLMTQYKTPGQISENWGRKIRGQYRFMEKWGYEYGLLEYCKRVGLIGLFWLGFLFGDRVMIPINLMKDLHDKQGMMIK